ncbi:hypothetical protein QYF36_001514 [Acer negundo]|nr:hypothetical protein QYF36_001514 [Acer negundo]
MWKAKQGKKVADIGLSRLSSPKETKEIGDKEISLIDKSIGTTRGYKHVSDSTKVHGSYLVRWKRVERIGSGEMDPINIESNSGKIKCLVVEEVFKEGSKKPKNDAFASTDEASLSVGLSQTARRSQ